MEPRTPKASLNLGKRGITKEFILEVKKRLEKKKVVKIKILKSGGRENKKELAEEISRGVGARVIDLRGNTFTLRKNVRG